VLRTWPLCPSWCVCALCPVCVCRWLPIYCCYACAFCTVWCERVISVAPTVSCCAHLESSLTCSLCGFALLDAPPCLFLHQGLVCAKLGTLVPSVSRCAREAPVPLAPDMLPPAPVKRTVAAFAHSTLRDVSVREFFFFCVCTNIKFLVLRRHFSFSLQRLCWRRLLCRVPRRCVYAL
jgi:hypothetical protein